MGDEKTRKGIEKMEEEDRVESDHHPMVVKMKERGVGREAKKLGREK